MNEKRVVKTGLFLLLVLPLGLVSGTLQAKTGYAAQALDLVQVPAKTQARPHLFAFSSSESSVGAWLPHKSVPESISLAIVK